MNGDVAETVRVFFEQSDVLMPVKKSNLSIQDVDDYLQDLSGMTKEEEQSNLLKKICKRFEMLFNSLAHQPFEKLGQAPCEMSVKNCVTGDVSHIIFWR